MLWAALSGAVSLAHAADFDANGFSLGAGLFVPYVTGTVRVREHDSRGDSIHLGSELGVDHAEAPGLSLSYRFHDANRLFLDVDYWVLSGTVAKLPHQLTFNEATLAQGTRLRASPDLFTVAFGYERTVLDLGERGGLALGVGFHFDWLNFVLDGTLAEDTVGHEMREDFNSQALPIPWLGASFRYALSDRLRLDLSARGFRAKGWNSGRTEVGTVYLSQADVDASAALGYALTGNLGVSGGVRYCYLSQTETSDEDGNDFAMSALGPTLGLAYRF